VADGRVEVVNGNCLAREIELEEIDTTPFRDRYGPNSVQITPQAAAD
jgi:hypothetical protein